MRLKFRAALLASFSLMFCLPALAQQTKIVGLKAVVTKEMRLQGISAWNYQMRTSDTNIRVEVAEYARDASGKFQRKRVFGQALLHTNKPLKKGKISFVWQDKQTLGSSKLTMTLTPEGSIHLTSGPTRFDSKDFRDYTKWGENNPAKGLKTDDGYILLAKYKNPHLPTTNIKDMTAYVGLKITTEK